METPNPGLSKALCARCGKSPATHSVGIPEPDLSMIGVCEPCKHLAFAELIGWLRPYKSHVTKDWYLAVTPRVWRESKEMKKKKGAS